MDPLALILAILAGVSWMATLIHYPNHFRLRAGIGLGFWATAFLVALEDALIQENAFFAIMTGLYTASTMAWLSALVTFALYCVIDSESPHHTKPRR